MPLIRSYSRCENLLFRIESIVIRNASHRPGRNSHCANGYSVKSGSPDSRIAGALVDLREKYQVSLSRKRADGANVCQSSALVSKPALPHGHGCAGRSIAAKARLRMTESLPALLRKSASDASWLRRTGRRYRGQGHCCAKQSAQQNGKAIASKRSHPSSGVVAAFARRAPEPGDFFSSQVRAAIRFNLPLSRSNEPINLNFTGRCARIRGYNSASVIGRLDSRSKCTATSAIFLVSTPQGADA